MSVYNVRIYGYSYETNRKTHYTARFDENGKLLNPKNIAKSSLFGWGKWQLSSRKVKCSLGSCWWVSTAGHGGYILVTQKKLDIPVESVFSYEKNYNGTKLIFHVYQFEEDCDWAVLEYFDETVLEDSRKKNDVKLSKEEYKEKYIIPTLQAYNKECLTYSPMFICYK